MLVVLSCGCFCIFCLSLCNELQSSLLILLLLGAPRSFSAIRHPNLRPPSPLPPGSCWKQQLQTLQLLDSPWTPNFLLGGLGWLRCLLEALGSPCSFGAGIGSALERKAFQIHQFPLHDLLKSDADGAPSVVSGRLLIPLGGMATSSRTARRPSMLLTCSAAACCSRAG